MIARISRALFLRQDLRLLESLQRELIQRQQAALVQTQMEYLRSLRDIILGWRVSLEKPEVDIRDDLDAMYRDLSDQVAALEEHVV